MNLQPQADSFDPNVEECLRLHKCWPWFLGLGAILVAVGALAVGSATIATLTTLVVFGSLLLVGGVVQIVNAFLALNWRGFFLHLLGGVLHLIVGGLMVERPDRAAEALTLMLAVAFLVGGAFRIVAAVATRFSGWAWVAVNGVITFALGVAIWRQWPESSYWVIGVFIGIDLIFNGWSWIMLALVVRTNSPVAQPSAFESRKEIPVGAK